MTFLRCTFHSSLSASPSSSQFGSLSPNVRKAGICSGGGNHVPTNVTVVTGEVRYEPAQAQPASRSGTGTDLLGTVTFNPAPAFGFLGLFGDSDL